jgi:hypothetical protein
MSIIANLLITDTMLFSRLGAPGASVARLAGATCAGPPGQNDSPPEVLEAEGSGRVSKSFLGDHAIANRT